jgi:hypothetical protein
MQSPCARLVRIMSSTILHRSCARKLRRTLRSHDRQRASRKLSVYAVALCSPCALMSSTILHRSCARRLRRTLRSHDCQRASRKLSVHAVALCSPCAHHAPHYNHRRYAPLRSSFQVRFLTNRNETEMGEMLTSRNRNETQNNFTAHFAKPKRNKKQVRCPPGALLVLFVNDSEYSKSAGTKPFCLLAVFISFPLVC